MFRIWYCWLLLIALGSSALRAQPSAHLPAGGTATHPGLTSAPLTPGQVEAVAALGQLWGFLKYYHPAVAAGQRDWDAELLRQLPKLLACHAAAEQRQLLSKWVSSLGAVPVCASCAAVPSRPVHSVPNLRWARNSRLFTPALRRQLAFIQINRYQGEPYYVEKALAGNALFAHEQAYADRSCPGTGLRILALCRYWSMVEYFSPYKNLAAQNWARVLPDLLPLFVAADTPLRYRHAVLVLSGRLQDGHATLAPDSLPEQETGNYLVPAAVQFIGDRAVVQRVRPDAPSPLKPGDCITHIRDQTVEELVRQRLPETPGSNRAARLRQIARELLFSTTPELTLAIIRDGQPVHITAPCRLIATLTPVPRAAADSSYRLLTPTIGYIDMAQIRKQKLPRMMQALGQTQGIVIDLRNYPSDFVPRELASYFLAQPTLFARYTQFDSRFPGRFLTSEPDTLLPQPGKGLPYTGQVVVLVNSTTLSLGEFTAMALRATPHCTILGSQTAGADGNRTRIVLPGGLITGMSGLGVFYPNGHPTQGLGIVPDIVLHPTPAGFRDGRDELRERAVELIANRRPTP